MINNLKTYFRGGIFLLSAGLIPFSNAFRECMMKCLVGDFADTSEIKSPDKRNKKGKHERKLCPLHLTLQWRKTTRIIVSRSYHVIEELKTHEILLTLVLKSLKGYIHTVIDNFQKRFHICKGSDFFKL